MQPPITDKQNTEKSTQSVCSFQCSILTVIISNGDYLKTFNSKFRGINGNISPKWCITIPDICKAPFICKNPKVLYKVCWDHFTHH